MFKIWAYSLRKEDVGLPANTFIMTTVVFAAFANRCWLTYCSVSFSVSSSPWYIAHKEEMYFKHLRMTEFQHNGTVLTSSEMSSCLKSKYLLFFVKNKLYVFQNSATV